MELASLHGRLLNSDKVTLNKDRMDYAHLLVSNTFLKELNAVADVWIEERKYGHIVITKITSN